MAREIEVQQLRERQAIREKVDRYCHAVDRCDLELLTSCYWADGYNDHGLYR